MVKTKRGYVLASAFTSGIALGLSLVALGTSQWVVAQGEFIETPNMQLSQIKYGLFSGTLFQKFGKEAYFTLYATCLIPENVCAYLCTSTADLRKAELRGLYRNEDVQFWCNPIARKNSFNYDRPSNRASGNNTFLNAGLYLSTAVFLVLSAIFGLLATILSVLNTAANPVEVVFSIFGLYICNTIAFFSSVMVLVLWGALFGSQIIHNLGIFYTIVGEMNASPWTNLGYSYWLNIPSMCLYATSIVLLYLRQYFISQEPEIRIHVAGDEKDLSDLITY